MARNWKLKNLEATQHDVKKVMIGLSFCICAKTKHLSVVVQCILQKDGCGDLETDSKKSRQNKKLTKIQNLQFLSYHHETRSKGPPQEIVILTKFHDDSSKIVD